MGVSYLRVWALINLTSYPTLPPEYFMIGFLRNSNKLRWKSSSLWTYLFPKLSTYHIKNPDVLTIYLIFVPELQLHDYFNFSIFFKNASPKAGYENVTRCSIFAKLTLVQNFLRLISQLVRIIENKWIFNLIFSAIEFTHVSSKTTLRS